MMANSARDPFWRAKVSHEILVNPAHSVGLQDKCTSCHAEFIQSDAHQKNIENKSQHKLDDNEQASAEEGMQVALYYEESRIGTTPNQMIEIPAGKFIMGTNDRLPDEGQSG